MYFLPSPVFFVIVRPLLAAVSLIAAHPHECKCDAYPINDVLLLGSYFVLFPKVLGQQRQQKAALFVFSSCRSCPFKIRRGSSEVLREVRFFPVFSGVF